MDRWSKIKFKARLDYSSLALFLCLKIKAYKHLTEKIKRLKIDCEKPILCDISKKTKILVKLQFKKKYAIILTDSKSNVTILLQKYYDLKNCVIFIDKR